jgi:dimethylargininase|tara:strand:+ start:2065 stop:2844 length:780 start_codon:yes stop_codon:yes gene_type:complete
MRIAVTRGISPAIGHCQLTHLEREPIDDEVARAQHGTYERVLRDLGCQVEHLAEEPDLPDSVFVEDIAVVLDEVAIITRPGAESRRGERSSIRRALEPHRRLEHIRAPGILDGGDVLVVQKDIYVGLSTRSDDEAVRQLKLLVADLGYTVTGVEVRGCLHLKSAVTAVSEDTLLINPDWIDATYLPGHAFIQVDPAEPSAANVVRVGDTVLFAADFPRTGERISAAGFRTLPVDASELAKAEGALTCCSLIFEAPDRNA